MQRAFDLIIFDCDGVLIDSEAIICAAEAEALTAAGYRISTEDLIKRFCGVPAQAMYRIIEQEWGRSLPSCLAADVKQMILDKYHTRLQPIEGAGDVVSALEVKKCVASGSAPDKLALGLRLTGLFDLFDPHIYSSDLVARGKPHPDIFIYAAGQLDVAQERCLVIEDSIAGVTAARAAGMTCAGFVGGSHCQPDHAEGLRDAGADTVIDDLNQLIELTA